MRTTKKYRYPGAKPFQTEESFKFYGRNQDTDSLYQRVLSEPLTILHSKSGMGKSSLINAGLIPHIQAGGFYSHQSIRFLARTDTATDTPFETTRQALFGQSDLLDKIRPTGDESLWYYLKARQLNQPNQGTILIFDQFEELFTYEPADYHQFANQLSEALYTTLPERFNEKLQEGLDQDAHFLSTEELAQLEKPINLRLLMVIRSDRMNLLKKIEDYFPGIMKNDYELEALAQNQAENAILAPAYLKDNFSTPIFDYEDDAIEYLIQFLSKGGHDPIESYQLQILCEYIEKEIVQEQGKTSVSKADLRNPNAILENYYLNKITAINDPDQRLAARRFIEEGLIFEDEKRRLSIYEGQVLNLYKVDQTLLDQLLDSHLIRTEPSLRGGYTYELSHDILVEPVLKAKNKRLKAERLQREKEAKEIEEQKLLELRQEAEAERKRAEQEKRLRKRAVENEKRARQRTRLAIAVSIFALIAAAAAIWQFSEAKKAQIEAEEQYERALTAQEAAEKKEQEAEIARAEMQRAIEEAGQQAALALEREVDLDLALNRIKELQEEFAGVTPAPEQRSVTIANEKMNVLYIGLANPLSLTASGVSDNQLEVSGKGAGLSITPSGPGRYLANVTTPGIATITVSHPAIGERIFIFRVKRLPMPQAQLGSSRGGIISVSRLKAQDKLRLQDFFDYDAQCIIQSFHVVRVPGTDDPLEVVNEGNQFSPAVRELIRAAKPGDIFHFDRINVLCPDGDGVRRVDQLRFEVE